MPPPLEFTTHDVFSSCSYISQQGTDSLALALVATSIAYQSSVQLKDRQCTYNVIFKRVRVTIVAVKK
jgi:hypothetical protein